MNEALQFGQHPDADQIGAFVEQALPAHEREQLLDHLALCPECRAIVALSLPPVEEPAPAPPASVRKPWWSGWTLALPAAAAFAALAVFVLYIHRAAVVQNAPAPAQIASSHPPAPPAWQGQSPTPSAKPSAGGSQKQTANADGAASAGRAGAAPKQISGAEIPAPLVAAPALSDRKVAALDEVAKTPVNPLAGSPAQEVTLKTAPGPVVSGGVSNGVGGALARAPSPVNGRRLEELTPTEPARPAYSSASPAPAPAARAATSRNSETVAVTSAPPIENVASDATIFTLATEETQIAKLKHPLPSRLPVLSMAGQARLLVAIDTRNAVFLSKDAGKHWKAISTQWQGRAVRASLIEPPVERKTGFSQDKPASLGVLQAGDPASSENVNGVAAARARTLADLPGSSLSGTVTDRTGAVIPGATVTVTDSATHTARTVKSDQSGHYLVEGLRPGTYELEARASGFKKEALAGVDVAANTRNVANLSLNVSAATEAVTVTSAPPTMETADAAGEYSISKKAKTRLAASRQPSPVFEIVTDSGDRWTSADGVTWKHM